MVAAKLARASAVILAVLGVVVALTGWIEDWPWWVGLGLMSPLGILFVLDDVTSDGVFGEPGDSDGFGGDFGGGDFGGGGGDGGGGG